MRDEDALLMRLVSDGDEHAFRTIVEKYQREIYNFFLRSTGNREDAEDLTQRLFLKLYQSAGSYRPDAALRTYLYRIATNLSISFGRWKRVRGELPLEALDASAAHPESADGSPRPDERAVTGELREAYLAALLRLPPEWRTVMELRTGRGFSYREIAEITGKSPSAVETILFRARRRLAEELKEHLR